MSKKRKDQIIHSFHSNILDEERSFLVYLPINYYDEHVKYPVLYHLDGDEIQLVEILDILGNGCSEDSIPELICVSVMNTDRTRDMSPVKTSFCKKPGADQFLNFFESELIPYINRNYRASQFRVLCGQSFSSVFTLFTMLEKAYLFSGYITTSLYFPQCKEYFMDKARKTFSVERFDDRYLFMTLGGLDYQYNKDKKTEQAIEELLRLIRELKQTGLKWDYRVYEGHGHCPEPSYSDGLNWIFNAQK